MKEKEKNIFLNIEQKKEYNVRKDKQGIKQRRKKETNKQRKKLKEEEKESNHGKKKVIK